jgi:antitoxin MazE
MEVPAMKARLVRIGNSRGVRLPKLLIEQAGLVDDVEIHARDGAIVIVPARKAREGWAKSAALLGSRNDDGLLDPPAPTRFDEEEWQW